MGVQYMRRVIHRGRPNLISCSLIACRLLPRHLSLLCLDMQKDDKFIQPQHSDAIFNAYAVWTHTLDLYPPLWFFCRVIKTLSNLRVITTLAGLNFSMIPCLFFSIMSSILLNLLHIQQILRSILIWEMLMLVPLEEDIFYLR